MRWAIPALGLALMPLRALAQPCGGPEIVLRDSIGTTSASTDGNWPLVSTRFGGGDFFVQLFPSVATQRLRLTSLRVVIGQLNNTLNWAYQSYHIQIWNSLAEAANYPLGGGPTLASLYFTVPTTGPVQFGHTADEGPGYGVYPTWDLSFDLSNVAIAFDSGQSFVLGFYVEGNGGDAGPMGVLECTEAGSSDYYVDYSDPSQYFTDFSIGPPLIQHSGRIAIALRGEAIVIPGDVSMDGVVNAADVSPFVAVLLDPAGATAAQRCAADMDQSGVVDGLDISLFVNALLHP